MITRKHTEGLIEIIASCSDSENYSMSTFISWQDTQLGKISSYIDPILKDVVPLYMLSAQSRGLYDFMRKHESIQELFINNDGTLYVHLKREDIPEEYQCKEIKDTKVHSAEEMLKMKHNLDDVIQQAGGSVSAFSIEKLKEMSAFELLNIISTNDIRFVYTRG